MSFSGDLRHTNPPCTTDSTAPMDGGSDPSVPLANLSSVQSRMDTLQRFLFDSVNSNTLISKDQMEMVNGEIASAIHQIIVNGAALLTFTQPQNQTHLQLNHQNTETKEDTKIVPERTTVNPITVISKVEEDCIEDSYEIIELDAVELLAEHIHFCDICGKGFKRDANLRMHMRAHGNQFKTPEALAKPLEVEKCVDLKGRRTRFSCPFVGCNRNKKHKKFRPLKSVICVKNHFKRSHCPKMYSCTRCNKKSFSVVADLRSHLKHCGESKWKCSCGTSFSRKDKLFGHMALFEGHMPAVMEEEGKEVAAAIEVEDEDEEDDCSSSVKDAEMGENCGSLKDNEGLFDGFLDEFGSINDYSFQDVLVSPNDNGLCSGIDDFFNY